MRAEEAGGGGAAQQTLHPRYFRCEEGTVIQQNCQAFAEAGNWSVSFSVVHKHRRISESIR